MKREVTQYEKACNAIVKAFAKKHEVDFDGWVSDDVGGVASFSCQYFFNIDDMVHDLKTNQKKNLILRWQEDGVDAHFRGDTSNINYRTYCMGLRWGVSLEDPACPTHE
jgi:hypothetical protein